MIAAQIARLRGRWEWKHYGHDAPPDLPQRLLAAGFEPEEPETLMVADLEAVALDAPPPPGIELRTVGAAGVDDLVAVHDAVFGDNHRALGAAVRMGWSTAASCPSSPTTASGPSGRRLELFPGAQFAGLYGDSTLPSHRGRGIFRALVARRAAIAREQGYRYLQADALETSRPLFERLGFATLTMTTPYVWSGSDPAYFHRAELIYAAITSLDGYVADEHGRWDWSSRTPRSTRSSTTSSGLSGTHLTAASMYEVLVAWETMDDPDPQMRDYAEIWRAAEKIVYSTTLEEVASARTRIERALRPRGRARAQAHRRARPRDRRPAARGGGLRRGPGRPACTCSSRP